MAKVMMDSAQATGRFDVQFDKRHELWTVGAPTAANAREVYAEFGAEHIEDAEECAARMNRPFALGGAK